MGASGKEAPMTARFLTVVAAAALLAPLAAAQGSSPQATLLQQANLLKQGNYRALYATYTPQFRRNCPYARFVRGQRTGRRMLGTDFSVTGIQVRMETPRRAIVAYRIVRGGRTVVNVTFRNRDVYTRIGARWHDQLDRVSSC
jgi:hypothetical protein